MVMDVLELIKGRKSIRHFKPDMPPRELILECLEAASWAPNPTSQQPWKFIVLTGDILKKTSQAIEEHFAQAAARGSPAPDNAPAGDMVRILRERKERNFNEMLAFLAAQGVDLAAIGAGNFTFHQAPVGILFATYPCKDDNFLKATVAAMENFLLAAAARGLGTCWMNAVSICQEHIKKALGLGPDIVLVDGIAVGYPVEGSPLNNLPRQRLPIDKLTEWPDR